MTPDQLIGRLEKRLQEAATTAVRTAAADSEAIIGKRLPPERIETLRAVRAAPKHHTLHLQLDFRRRYPYRGTKTERLFTNAVRRSRRQLVSTLKSGLIAALNK